MANFDLAYLALKMAAPTNEIITDDKGLPGAYVRVPALKLNQLLESGNGDDTIHPAFMVSNDQKQSLLIGKYEGKSHANRIYSLPGEDPTVNITLDTYETYCKNKGAGHHCITAAEWAYLALWCKKNGTLPWGNNNYGKDSRETSYVAIPKYKDGSGQTCRVATGTGPLKWSHNRGIDGIWDLNGNIFEWVSGIRLVYGELQVIPYNNAADIDVATGASSTNWKAINANATSYSDLFITPDGQGTTNGSVKLDMVSSKWTWKTTISDKQDSSRNCSFANIQQSGLSSFCVMYMRAMVLLSETGVDYEGDIFYANNGAAERCAACGGGWYDGAYNGVFCWNFLHPRSDSYGNFGGRCAFYE